MEEKAQISFEYLLTASFTIILAIFSAVLVEVLRGIALKAQADILTARARVIENIFSN
ncbi:MAG: hypothetical protein PHY04_00260 [Candidatus ainarchaeum sp.]|jgi:hypothetical protein|nr:hypothetical protein [Candidatus ainarchaeum sp.]MDD3085502.1 hypothetical protein [Candidatus ainarchaeum sp.]MDD4128155.1 hypothetical protein [Candidatus ainarchaeum sp.]MDD4467569.1 hypothetical protein [Candidatus ainarchaeum sp.]HPM86269.1 hypothetical protein [archaeon]